MFAHGNEPRGVLVAADAVSGGENTNAIVQKVEVLSSPLGASFNSGGHGFIVLYMLRC